MAGLRSYPAYYDIDVVPSKFKRKVKMPKAYREDEEALDVQDIRNVLLVCNNRRLKTYILVLASSGFRAVEALAIRHKDIDFSASPTDKGEEWIRNTKSDNLVFRVYKSKSNPNPQNIYFKIIHEFEKLLSVAGMDERKEDGIRKRRKITLHSIQL